MALTFPKTIGRWIYKLVHLAVRRSRPKVDKKRVQMPTLRTPNDEYNSLRGDVQRLLATLQENNRAAIEDRNRLQAKVDGIPEMFNQLRRENQAALEVLKKDFERMFVARASYDPEHKFILDKIAEYDRILREAKSSQDEYSQFKQQIKDNAEDIQNLQKHQDGAGSRVVMWGSIIIAIISLAINLLSHIHFS